MENVDEIKKINSNLTQTTKICLLMDDESYQKVIDLQKNLKAKTIEEVIRRSIIVYQDIEPHDEKIHGNQDSLKRNFNKRVEFRTTKCVIDLLENEKNETGKSYAETIRQSLRVMSQIVRNRTKDKIKII